MFQQEPRTLDSKSQPCNLLRYGVHRAPPLARKIFQTKNSISYFRFAKLHFEQQIASMQKRVFPKTKSTDRSKKKRQHKKWKSRHKKNTIHANTKQKNLKQKNLTPEN